jgi:polyisoprenoid-binding protein YceI
MRTTFIILLTFLFQAGMAQETKSMLSTQSQVSIYGTSNVHDWSEHCDRISGSVTVTEESGTLTMADLTFKVEVKAIKSGKETMDEYTWEALLYEKFPIITYKAPTLVTSASGNTTKVVANGTMTMAGKSRTEQITATCTVTPQGLKCSGKKVIDMTLYGVEPPSVMFGAMTVGKEVEIVYEILFK